jgi:hypothetical protein
MSIVMYNVQRLVYITTSGRLIHYLHCTLTLTSHVQSNKSLQALNLTCTGGPQCQGLDSSIEKTRRLIVKIINCGIVQYNTGMGRPVGYCFRVSDGKGGGGWSGLGLHERKRYRTPPPPG